MSKPHPLDLFFSSVVAEILYSSELKIATIESLHARWSSGKPGQFFRCALCGHKFKLGDKYRVLYTNDMPKAKGNPIICERCNDKTATLRARWYDRCREYASEKFWWFKKHDKNL